MNSIHKNILKYIVVFVIISIQIESCSYKNIYYETGPDLIIENAKVKENIEEGKDQTGMPVRTGYKILNIVIRIKNIGIKSFNSPLYIASTNSERDYLLDNYNSFELLEPSPSSIKPNEVIETRIIKRVVSSTSKMKLQINFNIDQSKVAKEINNFNNTYIINY